MNTMVNKKVAAWSFLLIVVMVSAAVPAVRHVVYENKVVTGLDAYAETIVDESLKRATYAYALARSFNAVISVIQESHLQVEPGGVGVSIALGEALDPINDLIERFSWVMLASLVSLGIQKAGIMVRQTDPVRFFCRWQNIPLHCLDGQILCPGDGVFK